MGPLERNSETILLEVINDSEKQGTKKDPYSLARTSFTALAFKFIKFISKVLMKTEKLLIHTVKLNCQNL